MGNELKLPSSHPLMPIARSVNAGDPAALVRLRAHLRASREHTRSLGGDLSREANLLLVTQSIHRDRAMREAVFQELDHIRTELMGGNTQPTGIERLIIEDVVATWLHLQRVLMMYAEQENPTFRSDDFYQKQITAAQKRYHASLRALIDARRRPLPNIQINVADNQVNVAGNVTAVPPPSNETPAPLG
jgi:hypothetical protein